MLTTEQAVAAKELHFSRWDKRDGHCQVLRRNGKTQIWKSRPLDFRFPGKWGLKDYYQVTPANCHLFHDPSNCPKLKETINV